LPANFSRVQSVEFDLIVSQNGNEVERFESLSMQRTLDYSATTVINNQNSGSRYITASLPTSANTSGAGLNAPAEVTLSPLSAGSDGSDPLPTDYIGDPTARSGLFAFDTIRIQLLACPESTSSAVVTSALTYCENRGDAMFVGTTPYGYDLNGMKTYASTFGGRKVYGALYGPWIQVVNPLDTSGKNPLLWIPPVGHILGMYARIGDQRGVWKAPAGDEARLNNALGVALDMTDTDHTDLVKNGGVNGVRAIPGLGIIVDASRTLSTDTRWLFVNVRRLFNYVKSSVLDGLRFVAQEPHSEALRRAVVFNVLKPFLLDLWRRGAFGSDSPDKVFTVKCDAENNPPALVNQGIFTVELYFYPVKPAETIVIIVGQQESGATAAEA
jgi:phage tail sheath protein FI